MEEGLLGSFLYRVNLRPSGELISGSAFTSPSPFVENQRFPLLSSMI